MATLTRITGTGMKQIIEDGKKKLEQNIDTYNLGDKLNNLLDMGDEPFEPLYIYEVAMDNDVNESRKMFTHLSNKKEGNVVKGKGMREVK